MVGALHDCGRRRLPRTNREFPRDAGVLVVN
jgi:hypothetical protein